MRIICLFVILSITIVCFTFGQSVFAQDETELAKKTQNPLSNLISVPFQNNFNFNVGPDNDTQYLLNIQPVYPMNLNKEWNWIHRLIIPVINQPELVPGTGDTFGLSDIQYQGYFSPAKSGELLWGIGPVVSFPTASDKLIGTEKWSAGPGGVVLKVQGPWVIGVIANNIWSFAGDDDRADVNQMLLQYFINYNFPSGMYVTTAPIITANWEADSDDRWTVPFGGGIGKIFRIGKLPINTSVSAYYNVEHPDNGPEWQARLQFQFLFPKR